MRSGCVTAQAVALQRRRGEARVVEEVAQGLAIHGPIVLVLGQVRLGEGLLRLDELLGLV